ncbi:MAG: hypothetical protein K0S70_76 [Microbacterium sp.]|nr:hypothetical protein [Microbacterium sp.]
MNDKHPDEYVGLAINDVGATLPPEAKLYVVIDTRDWAHFEEMVQYLTALELPGLNPVQIERPTTIYAVPTAVRRNADFTIGITVQAPSVTRPRLPEVDPATARAEEVLARVSGS